MRSETYLFILLLWAVFSSIVILLGIAYAGIDGMFAPPGKNAGIASIVMWAISLIVIIMPFILLILRYAKKLTK